MESSALSALPRELFNVKRGVMYTALVLEVDCCNKDGRTSEEGQHLGLAIEAQADAAHDGTLARTCMSHSLVLSVVWRGARPAMCSKHGRASSNTPFGPSTRLSLGPGFTVTALYVCTSI